MLCWPPFSYMERLMFKIKKISVRNRNLFIMFETKSIRIVGEGVGEDFVAIKTVHVVVVSLVADWWQLLSYKLHNP